MPQRCHGGVRLLGSGPCQKNVERIDAGAVPWVAAAMEHGMHVDLDHFARMDHQLTDDMEATTESVRAMTGYYCNLDSGDQVADLLFKKMGMKQARLKMTKSGDRESVEDEVLTAIQHDHPVVPKIQEFKEFSKLRGTYVRPMPKLAKRFGAGDWRLIPHLGQNRVPSGRFQCKDPNLLAMPTRTERGREIRKGFIAPPGWMYVTADLSQIEPRVAAHCSHDPGLIDVYLNEEDIYSDFATTAFGLTDKRYKDDTGKWKYPTVDKDLHRRPSKTCVLAALYDVTAAGLLEQLPVVCKHCLKPVMQHTCSKFEAHWTENKAQDLLNKFYMKYPGVLRDRKLNHARVRKFGYIFDMWGRILHVAAVRSTLEWVVSGALREAANLPYQGGACGVLKLTMAQVEDDRVSMGLTDLIHCQLPVHDELLYIVREDLAEDWAAHVVYRLEGIVKLEVPVKAESAIAATWGDIAK
jgi:DNA polymerase-1